MERRRSIDSVGSSYTNDHFDESLPPPLPLAKPNHHEYSIGNHDISNTGRRRSSISTQTSRSGSMVKDAAAFFNIQSVFGGNSSSSSLDGHLDGDRRGSFLYGKEKDRGSINSVMIGVMMFLVVFMVVHVGFGNRNDPQYLDGLNHRQLSTMIVSDGIEVRDGNIIEMKQGFGHIETYIDTHHYKIHDDYDDDEFDSEEDKKLQLSGVCYKARTFKACSKLINIGNECHWSNWRKRCRVNQEIASNDSSGKTKSTESGKDEHYQTPTNQGKLSGPHNSHHPQAVFLAPPIHKEECLNDSSKCPRLPEGVFAKEYKERFCVKENKPCNECVVEEHPSMNPSCYALCYELFATNARPWGKHISEACQIGCGYREHTVGEAEKKISKNLLYARAVQASTGECMMSCKDTVFGYESDGKCNLPNGLGIAVSLRHFNAEMACEIGCLIGGERICPYCDEVVSNAEQEEEEKKQRRLEMKKKIDSSKTRSENKVLKQKKNQQGSA